MTNVIHSETNVDNHFIEGVQKRGKSEHGAVIAEDNAPPDPCLVTATENIVNNLFVEGMQKQGEHEHGTITAEDIATPMTAEDSAAPNPCLATVNGYDSGEFLLERFDNGSTSDRADSWFSCTPASP